MFEIERELEKIRNESFAPDESLRRRVRAEIKNRVRADGAEKARKARRAGTMYKAFSAAAVAAALLIIFSFNFFTPAVAAGYYTIDINPSVSVAVDADDNVISVKAENDDASDVLLGLSLTGKKFEEALRLVINAAVRKNYLKPDGNVLVAHFGGGGGITQLQLSAIVSEASRGDIAVLVLNGDKTDFENAQKSGERAGIALLMSDAKKMGIENGDVGSLIRIMNGRNNKDVKPDGSAKNAAGAAPSQTAEGGGADKEKPDKDKKDNKDDKDAKKTQEPDKNANDKGKDKNTDVAGNDKGKDENTDVAGNAKDNDKDGGKK